MQDGVSSKTSAAAWSTLRCMIAVRGGTCDRDVAVGDAYCRRHRGRRSSRVTAKRAFMARAYVGRGVVTMPGVDLAVSSGNGGRGGTIPLVMTRSTPLGAPRRVDPGVALLEEVWRSAGHVAWLEAKVRSLEEAALTWGRVMAVHEERFGGQGGDYTLDRTESRAILNVWWDLYERERKHLASTAAAALKAGVEERRVRLAERGVDALYDAMAGALEDLGLDPGEDRVRRAVGARLREVLALDPTTADDAERRSVTS